MSLYEEMGTAQEMGVAQKTQIVPQSSSRESQSKERGVTLVEVMMVLGIATAFIAGGLALYNNAQQGLEARDAVASVMGAVAEIRGVYAASDSFLGLGSVGVKNPFGSGNISAGAVGTDAGAVGTALNSYALIYMDGIDTDICARVVTAINAVDDVAAWTVDSTASGKAVPAVTAGAAGPPITGGSLNTAASGTAGSVSCGTAATTNYLVVTIKK